MTHEASGTAQCRSPEEGEAGAFSLVAIRKAYRYGNRPRGFSRVGLLAK